MSVSHSFHIWEKIQGCPSLRPTIYLTHILLEKLWQTLVQAGWLLKMTVVFRGQTSGQSVKLSHSAHRNSLAEWPVERREHCDQDMAHSAPPAPTYSSHRGVRHHQARKSKSNIRRCPASWDQFYVWRKIWFHQHWSWFK